MKKFVKGALCAGLALTMCAAVGCKTKQANNPEVRHLSLAVGALDGNFNPFSYTSQNDGEMIGMTQLSLLTINNKGKIVYGENEVCAALDMKTTMYDAAGQVTTKGDNDGRTEYEITLKKGIMFSDGKHELTIKDVLFNLYVYLDPAYTGSTTIYSTNIQGLKAYRTQDPQAQDDGSGSSVDSLLVGDVNVRIENIVKWAEHDTESTAGDQIDKDVTLAKSLFLKEIESDWTSTLSGWEESYKKAYQFTEAWQAYLFTEGLVTVQEKNNASTNTTTSIYYDADPNDGDKFDSNAGDYYYTTLVPYQPDANVSAGDIASGRPGAYDLIEEVEAATTDEKVNEYLAKDENKDATRDDAILALQKEACINLVYKNYTTRDEIGNVVQYWATASTLYDEILGELRTAHYEQVKQEHGGKLAVESISGITATKKNGYDVLKIVINGVDPKAVFNFAFPIAPLYYYSGTYKGTNYVEEADPAQNKFGVDFGNSDFYNKVICDPDKSGVPVGAGAYRATTSKGGDNPTRATFNVSTNSCYFKRNDYFNTVGNKIENAKIKYIDYKVYNDSKIMDALQSGEIDYGQPNATAANVTLVTKNRKTLSSTHYRTGGYGYIGINPKAVPEYPVRQAIMKAINTGLAVSDYYSKDLAEVIYRPMSKTSWAYPDGATEYDKIAYDTTDTYSEIKELMAQAGYVIKGGKYVKDHDGDGMMNNSRNSTKLTFTIAGESTDHPAYMMFTRAADTLNDLGFDITVTTSTNALKSLVSGDLQVWAAAWSSSTDPDMYQIYHRDSTATSVNNWNYKNILKEPTKWSYEYGIIDELSKKIDEARTYLEDDERKPIYADCLDLIMDLAVELPTYQRHDLCVYNHKVIDAKSLVSKPNNYIGLFDKIWEINYV